MSVAAGIDNINAFLIPNKMAEKDITPDLLVARVIALLKARQPDLELVDDLNAVRARGKKSAAVVDVRGVLGQRSGDRNLIDLAVVFFDERLQPISRVTGQGVSVIPYPAFDPGVTQAATQALQQLDGKLDGVLR